ncbi:MAG: hypothetical protein KBS96_01745 [Lachnospiraceae bacterium]|nr:hypothetical protein [Candidatus Colinaster scatohippi]
MRKRVISCVLVIALMVIIVHYFNPRGESDLVVKLPNGQLVNEDNVYNTPLLVAEEQYLNGEISRVIYYEYDEFNRIIRRQAYNCSNNSGNTNELWQTLSYTYKDDGSYNIDEQYYSEFSEHNLFTYDKYGREIKSEYHLDDGENSINSVNTAEYIRKSPKCIVVVHRPPDPQYAWEETKEYDSHGNEINVRIKHYAESIERTGNNLQQSAYDYTYKYDEHDNIISVIQDSHNSTLLVCNYRYNNDDSLLNEERTDYSLNYNWETGEYENKITGRLITDYTYDNQGLLMEENAIRYDEEDCVNAEFRTLYYYEGI